MNIKYFTESRYFYVLWLIKRHNFPCTLEYKNKNTKYRVPDMCSKQRSRKTKGFYIKNRSLKTQAYSRNKITPLRNFYTTTIKHKRTSLRHLIKLNSMETSKFRTFIQNTGLIEKMSVYKYKCHTGKRPAHVRKHI